MNETVSIIIPTWNNPDYLIPCVQSIVNMGVLSSGFCRLIIVDNGQKIPVYKGMEDLVGVTVLRPGKNLGWEGGLKAGLEVSKSKFVCFQNDDTFLPKVSINFYQKLLSPFQDDSVGIVGPSTTTASGVQSIFNPSSPLYLVQVPWVIFFCAMVRRDYLDQIGGVDDTLPGGDDFDMCIRMNNFGKRIVVNPDAFIIHHGFVTGTRVHGDHTVKDGWNNVEFTDKVNRGLINKHGFKTFIENRMGYKPSPVFGNNQDLEGDLVRSYVNGAKDIVELGCGGQKTIEKSIGVDIVPKGDFIPNLSSTKSVADVMANVQGDLPFENESQDTIIVRHVLEHCVDSISTIKNWKKHLKIGGHLIIAVPDEKVGKGIPMNPEHVHAFTEESLGNLMETLGFKIVGSKNSGNGVSFVGCYERVN